VSGLYVVGGQQRSPRPVMANDEHWYEYQKGIILRVDPENGCVEPCVEYTSPAGACAPGDPVLFKAGTLEADRLYVCTQTEILIYALPHFEQVGYFSLPCFNDVHHVRPTRDGHLLVANSGLEMVMELAADGQVVREWNVLGEAPWEKFSRQVDYRQGINLKPHRAHPNSVFYVGEEIWATRFEQKDAVCLTDPQRRLPIGLERVHDGVVHAGRVYFTTVNGFLVIADPASLCVVEAIDLNAMHPSGTLLGWCRGLAFENEQVWVGFSRIRPTKFRQALSWVRQGFAQALPTHIACYDLSEQRCLMEIDLEAHQLNAVFSIHLAQ
jgi:hypothetical protein